MERAKEGGGGGEGGEGQMKRELNAYVRIKWERVGKKTQDK